MKRYILLWFFIVVLLLSATNALAQSTRKTRRSNSQSNISSSTDFDKFVGVWVYTPDEFVERAYFKVTKVQPQKFNFIEGFEDQGKIYWAATMLNNVDAIYLKPVRGKLAGQFNSPNFRATHGHDMNYRITLSLEANGKLLYSVSGDLGPEKYYATKVSGGDNKADAVPSDDATTKSNIARKVLAEKSWQAFWTKFSGAIYKKDFKTLVQLSSSNDVFFDGLGSRTSKDWFNMMSSEWNLVKKAVMSGVGRIQTFDGDEQYKAEISRTTNKHIPMIFQFEKDNKWRFSGVMGD